MVRGIEIFKEYFGNYTGQYTFIGGTACDIILGRMGVDFRQTKFEHVTVYNSINTGGNRMNNKEIVKYFYETVVSQNLLDEVCKYVSVDCKVRSGEHSIPIGVDGMKQHLADVKKTYPDYTMKIIRQYCDGDYIISEFIMEGTHAGEWLGMKPTNKKLSFTGVDIDKIIDGKIVEHGGAVNTFDTLFEEKIIKPA